MTVSFVNNTAMQVGGAIFVTEDAAEVIDDAVFDVETLSLDCFYQLTSNPEIPGLLRFENNSALIGDNIYGAGLFGTCLALYVPRVRSYSVANSTFKFLTPTLSDVSSSAKRVCLCENGIPRCADMYGLPFPLFFSDAWGEVQS